MDLKPNYKIDSKDAKADPIVFQVVHTCSIMELRRLTQYPPIGPFIFEDL